MQAAGPEAALITGETVRLRFSVKGYDAPESWDIYWTGRQVGTSTHFVACLSTLLQSAVSCMSIGSYVYNPKEVSCFPP